MSAPLARRILVALDASPGSLAALEAAAELAARVAAELRGLFVEDIDLVRLAELPFAHHVGLPRGTGEPFDLPDAEAQFHALAARARSALESALSRRELEGGFRVARGRVEAELLAASAQADLLVVGFSSRALGRGGRLGRTARAAAERASGSVLLLPAGARLEGPVRILVEAGLAAAAARQAGAALAAALGVRTQELVVADPASARGALAADPGGIVVVVADGALVRDGLGALLQAAACPVLVVRSPAP